MEIAKALHKEASNIGSWLKKLAPVIILSIGRGEGTVMWSPEYRRCGIVIETELMRYSDHVYLKQYTDTVRNILTVLAFIA